MHISHEMGTQFMEKKGHHKLKKVHTDSLKNKSEYYVLSNKSQEGSGTSKSGYYTRSAVRICEQERILRSQRVESAIINQGKMITSDPVRFHANPIHPLI